MKYLVSLSVVAYAKPDKKLFDYLIESEQKPVVGSICEVEFGRQKSLGIVRKVAQLQAANTAKLKSIQRVLDVEPMPSATLSLADWLIDYYVATCRSAWLAILPSGILHKLRKQTAASTEIPPTELKKLTPTQQSAYQKITETTKPALLFGVTGSGKTEVYLHLIADTLAAGKSAILLVPEIIMTPQIIEQLSRRFSSNLIVTHSKLTAAQRKRAWLNCLSATTPRVVIGPRSALFMPLHNLGIVIIDEEHEQSYKQEQSPRYHANYVAAELCRLTGAKLVLGSATPSLQTYWLCEQGKIELVRMDERINAVSLPQVQIKDLTKHHDILSDALLAQIQGHLDAKHQVILFLNRRGSASALLCQTCGHSIRCPNCETSLTFHADSTRLICHYCGFSKFPPAQCPECHGSELQYIGTGTKGVEEAIMGHFAKYRVGRLDRDNATLQNIQQLYTELRSNQLDILIGTQMVARGLDIDNVEFVGVLLADGSLNIPDFSASERTFQLLTQVAGRAGRKSSHGEAIIQTYSPKHPAILAAAEHNYEQFYREEIEIRKKYHYPPYVYLAKLVFGHNNPTLAQKHASELADELKQRPEIVVLGPVSSFIPRSSGKYLFQVVLKSKTRKHLVDIARTLKPGWTIELDPINLI
ncbi:primosomal protein N' [bacterium]|nr:primosomal protein N' [bacterium]